MSLKVIHCRDNSKHNVLAAATTGFREFLSRNGGTADSVFALLDHVKGEIRSRLPDGIPYVDTIADAVGLQRWTLQRRLADYGLSFSEVIDRVRRELAEQHIRQAYVSILEMSDMLGYSELSAFSRAFRRWFGVSPQKYRIKHLCCKVNGSRPSPGYIQLR